MFVIYTKTFEHNREFTCKIKIFNKYEYEFRIIYSLLFSKSKPITREKAEKISHKNREKIRQYLLKFLKH